MVVVQTVRWARYEVHRGVDNTADMDPTVVCIYYFITSRYGNVTTYFSQVETECIHGYIITRYSSRSQALTPFPIGTCFQNIFLNA